MNTEAFDDLLNTINARLTSGVLACNPLDQRDLQIILEEAFMGTHLHNDATCQPYQIYLLRQERYALIDAPQPRTAAQEQRLAELDDQCEAAMPVHYRKHEDYADMWLIRVAAALLRQKGFTEHRKDESHGPAD